MGKKVLMTVAAIMAMLLVAGCSDDDKVVNENGGPTTAENSIGPDGGTIQMAGKARLVIPPGALTDTVDFAMSVNDSPTAPAGPMRVVSPAITIEPSGTQFDSAATLTLWYNPSALGGAEETAVSIHTCAGVVWEELPSAHDTVNNLVEADIMHLSDYAALADTTSIPTEGVYAKLIVGRMATSIGGGDPVRSDSYEAAFDSAYAPCDAIIPLHPVTVSCNGQTLVWDEILNLHKYPETYTAPFIILGNTYTFTVTAGALVPALTESIDFPATEPYITYPTYPFDTVYQASGFTVTWANSGSGTVELILLDLTGEQILFTETANDGSHEITAAQLSGLVPGMYSLTLNFYNREYISAPGYDSRSFIAGRVMSTSMFQME
jgi:hypothetical protein